MILITTEYHDSRPPCTVAVLRLGTVYRCVRQLHDTGEVDILAEGPYHVVWATRNAIDAVLSHERK